MNDMGKNKEKDDFLFNRKFFYKLENKKVINCDFWEYVENREKLNWQLKVSKLIPNIKVSTVFLGVDLNYGGREPVCFETMVFGGKFDKKIFRAKTYDQAIINHNQVCLKVMLIYP